MFVSCGEINEFTLNDTIWTVSTDKDYIYNLISNEENIAVIKRAFKYLGFDFDFKIIKTYPKDIDITNDINFLINKFGKDNIIIDE